MHKPPRSKSESQARPGHAVADGSTLPSLAAALGAAHGDCSFELCARQDPQRAELEAFVHQVFARHYDADVQHFFPHLLALRERGRLQGVLGFAAAHVPLFLEQYLDEPVEQALQRPVARPVRRKSIMEVGNLAAASAGGTRALITALTAYLRGAGYQWVVFTAGRPLQNSFARMGIQLLSLAEARPERLHDGADSWGSYYAQRPQVLAGNVAQGYRVLQRRLTHPGTGPRCAQLWNRAYAAGYSHRAAPAA